MLLLFCHSIQTFNYIYRRVVHISIWTLFDKFVWIYNVSLTIILVSMPSGCCGCQRGRSKTDDSSYHTSSLVSTVNQQMLAAINVCILTNKDPLLLLMLAACRGYLPQRLSFCPTLLHKRANKSPNTGPMVQFSKITCTCKVLQKLGNMAYNKLLLVLWWSC